MPVCTKCGQDNPDVARFCLACGSPLAEAPAATEERKVVTVLFCDIVGSTATAEQLDPEDVRARLAPYYERARTELERYGGTVEKFIGDAVVALFGAPVAHEDDPERAVRAALAIRAAMAELNAEDAWLDIHIRVAVHTGEALVVLGASALEGEGMAAGDVMNTAARLQSGAPIDGIVVGEATYRATAATIEYEEAPPVEAKGKAAPIPIWAVVGEKAPADRPVARTRLVGRVSELEVLRDAWSHARTKRASRVVTVIGPPGIGKSRLLVALAERVEAEADVHWGRCLPYGEGITYWPVTEILKSATSIRHDDDHAAVSEKLGALLESLPTSDLDELRTIAAAAAHLLGVATTPLATYSAQEIGRSELHWGLRRLLDLLAQRRPLLLIFEDLHWAEPTLVELIRSIPDTKVEAPMLLVASARPELKEAHPSLGAPDEKRDVVDLPPLDDDESRALLAELAGDSAGTTHLETLLRNAGGNPLFLEETVRMLADVKQEPAGLSDELPVPETLQALIGSRLDSLPAADKRIAQHASVVGRVFWIGAVAHLDGNSGDLTDNLATLERRDFVLPHLDSAISGDREYAFKHILIRDVAYDRLPKGRRAELHVRFTDWLRGVSAPAAEFVEIVAYHLEQACHLASQIARSPIEPPRREAGAALAAAAEKAQRREGWREAQRYYDRALAVLDAEDAERRLEIRLARARTFAGVGALQQAWEELVEVAEAALAFRRPDLRAAALVTLGNIDHRQGRPTDGRGRLAEAERLAEEVGDSSLHIRAVFGLAAIHGDYEGEFTAAVDTLRDAIGIAEDIGDRALEVEGHLRLGFHLFNMGEIAAAEGELTRCTELAGELGSLRDQARAAFLLGLARYYGGETHDAQKLNLQARDWLDRTGEGFFQMQNYRALALYALADDDLHLAERWLREAIPIVVEEGGRHMLEVYRFLTETLVRQGRLHDAETLVEFSARSIPEEDPVAQAYVLLARAALATGTANREAIDTYVEAIGILERQGFPIEAADARLTFANALSRLGELDEARTQLTAARAAFQAMGVPGPRSRRQVVASGAAGAGPARAI